MSTSCAASKHLLACLGIWPSRAGTDRHGQRFAHQPLTEKNSAIDQNGVIEPKERDTIDTKVGTKVDTNGTVTEHKSYVNDNAIMQAIRDKPKITQKDICAKTGIPLRTVKRTIVHPHLCSQ